MSVDAPARAGRSPRLVALASSSQAMSAASNFLIAMALGRGGGEVAVAPFALAFIVYNAILGLQRALVTDVLLAVPFDGDRDGRREDAMALTTALALGAVSAAVVLTVGSIADHPLVWLAFALPGMLLEDALRYLLFRRGRVGAAALVDATWAAVSISGFLVLVHHPTTNMAFVIWGAGGLLGSVVGLRATRLRPAPLAASLTWWRAHVWTGSRWLAIESVIFHMDQLVTGFGLAFMAGKAAFGEWQITESLLGVAAFLNVGLLVTGITHMSRVGNDRRTAWVSSLSGFGFVVFLTGALVVVREPLTQFLYDGNVDLAVSTIVATGAFLALGSASSGPISVLRAGRNERPLPIARAVAFLAFSPVAVLVAGHSFTAALWILAAGSLAYLMVVTWAARDLTAQAAPVAEPAELVR